MSGSWRNRDVYDNEVLAPLRLLVEEFDVRFAKFAPEFVGDPKRSIFRIYRDVRFSKDKSPYKTHAASWFKHQNSGHGVGSETHGGGAGFYFHLEPGASFVGGGIWMPPRAIAEPAARLDCGKAGGRSRSRMSGTGVQAAVREVERGGNADAPPARLCAGSPRRAMAALPVVHRAARC